MVEGKLRLKENEHGVAIIAGQIDGLKFGDNGLTPSGVQGIGDEIAVAAATAAAAAQGQQHDPNPLLVMDKRANDKLTYFTTDQVKRRMIPFSVNDHLPHLLYPSSTK